MATADHVSEVQSIRTMHSHGNSVSGTFSLTYGTGVSTSMEKQVIAVHGDGGAILSGGYKLNFNNENTTCLKFDATAAVMKTALENLAAITTVDVFRSGDASVGYSYTIAFMDSTADQAELAIKGGPEHGHDSCRGLWYGGEKSSIQTVPATYSGENFTVSVTTTDEGGTHLSHDSTAEEVKKELDKIPGVKNTDVSRSLADLQNGYYWTVSFDGNNGNLAELTCTGVSFSGTCAISTLVDGNYISGSFVLNLGSESTQPIDISNSDSSVVAAELQSMSTIDAVAVTRSGPDMEGGYSWTITFTTSIGDIGLISVDNSLVGVGAKFNVQELQKGNWISGSFALTYGSETTGLIVYDAEASVVEQELESLSTVGDIMVSRSSADTQRGYIWYVTFIDPNMPGDLPLINGLTNGLSGRGATVHAREVQKGSEAVSTSVPVSFSAPLDNGGSPITKYRVDMDTSSTFASGNFKTVDLTSDQLLREVQQITTTATAITEVQVVTVEALPSSSLAGSWTLSFDTSTGCEGCAVKSSQSVTVPGIYNSAGSLQSSLRGMSNTGNQILVSESGSLGNNQKYVFTITFAGGWVKGDVPLLTADSTGLNGSVSVTTLIPGDTTSGSFALIYEEQYTEKISAHATAASLRNALEAIDSIKTCSVNRVLSRVPLPGTIDVVHGNAQITTSVDLRSTLEVGDLIFLQGMSYRVGSLSSTTINLVDDFNTASSFKNLTATGITGYVWGNGYTWSVTFHKVEGILSALDAPLHSMGPTTVALSIRGGEAYTVETIYADAVTCNKCLYFENLSMGSVYWLRVWAMNSVGMSASASTPISVTPKRVPSAPENVKLYVVSGTELEVFFDPPTSDGGSQIVSYQVEWDTVADFNSGAVSSKLVQGGAIAGTPPFSTMIGSNAPLTPNTAYYVRVRANNDVPHQFIYNQMNYKYQLSLPFSARPINVVPNPPSAVTLTLLSRTSLRLVIVPPTRVGGASVSHYKIEYDTQSTFNSGSDGASLSSSDISVGSMTSLAGSSLVYDITGLSTGVVYHVRVAAKNSVGVSAFKNTSPGLAIPTAAPSQPLHVVASTLQTQEYPIREIDVAWSSQSDSGGNPVSAYKVEHFANYAIKEVQTVETTNADQGYFKLYFRGGPTTDMTFDVSSVNMRYALMNINSGNCLHCIKNIVVTREGATNGYKWHITFMDSSSNNGDQPPIVGNIGTLTSTLGGTPAMGIRETVTGRRANGGSPEVQEITVSGNAALTGFWRASFAGSGYGNYISWDAANTDVKRELEMLSTVGIVDVSRTGDGTSNSCGSACSYGYKWRVTFKTNVGNVPKILVTNSDLYAGGTQTGSSAVVMDGDNQVNSANGEKLCSDCYPGETPAEYGTAILPPTTFSYRITQRVPGTAYFVRVAAANIRGYGPVGLANSGSTIVPPKQQPGKPTNGSISVYFGVSSKLRFRYSAPLTDGGDPILKYMVEYDTSKSFSNAGSVERRCPTYPIRQTFTMHMKLKNAGDSFVPYDGTIHRPSTFRWTLTRGAKQYSTQKFRFDTKAMAVDEAANGDSDLYTTLASPINTGSVQSNLENLPALGSYGAGGAAVNGVNVVRSGSISGVNAVGYTWTITFLGDGNDFDIDVLPINNLIKTAYGDAANSTYGDETYVEFVKTKLFDGQAYTSCTETDVILPGLVQGTPYYTRVIAYNTLGYGLTATLSTAQKPMRVPQSPAAVTVTVSSGTSLRV